MNLVSLFSLFCMKNCFVLFVLFSYFSSPLSVQKLYIYVIILEHPLLILIEPVVQTHFLHLSIGRNLVIFTKPHRMF